MLYIYTRTHATFLLIFTDIIYGSVGVSVQVQQAEGVQRLVMRVDCRLIEYIMDRWNINVHNEGLANHMGKSMA